MCSYTFKHDWYACLEDEAIEFALISFSFAKSCCYKLIQICEFKIHLIFECF